MLNNNQQQNPAAQNAINKQNPIGDSNSGTPSANGGGMQLNSNSSRRAVGAPSLSGMPANGEPMNGFGMGGPSISNGTTSNPGLQTMSSIQQQKRKVNRGGNLAI